PPPPPKPPEKEVDEVAKLVRAIQDHKPQMRVAIKPVKKDEPRKAPAVAPKRDDVRAKKMAARAQEMSNLADRLNKMRTSAESLFTEGKFRAARIKYEGYKKEYQDSYKQKQALIEYQIAACYINEGNKAKGRSILRNLLANPGRFEGEVPKRAKPLFARLNAALSRRMVDSGPTVKIPRRRLSRERQSAAVSRKVGFFFKNSIRRYFVKRVGKSIAANFSVEIDILSSGMVRVRKLRVNSFSGRLPQESFEKKLKDFIESNLRFEPIRGKTESIKIDNQPIKVG
ncbi:MAG: hypothetical protein HQ564_06410, partial [Candidatus Saganbacteria bacterium]|nr:hypothetical protein [Candidatus Saganbacteria bacterium]